MSLQNLDEHIGRTNKIFLITTIAISSLFGLLIALNSNIWLVLTVLGLMVAVSLIPFFAKRPEVLFYVYMLSFVFGVVGFQIGNDLPKISFSNLLFIYAPILLVIFSLTKRASVNKALFGTKRRIFVSIGSLILLFQVVISGVVNSSLRFLLTQLGYFLVVFVVLYIVRDVKTLRRGTLLAILSIGILSTLTILTSMGVLSFGFRVNWNSGTAPWESILPRAIGLPQMDGGYHGVFILSFLPLAGLLAFKGKRQGVKSTWWLYLISFLGLSAIAIAIFRSAWLGTGVSLFVVLLIAYKSYSSQGVKAKTIFVTPFILLIIGFLVAHNFTKIEEGVYYFLFDIRKRGVETRIEQYKFALNEVFSSPKGIVVGYGHGSFRNDFFDNTDVNLDSPIGLHNHFLGFLYADGLPYLIVYVLLIFFTIYWLYKDAIDRSSQTNILSLGLLAGLIGDIVILNFTAALSGYKIIWVIISLSAILPDLQSQRTR